MTAPAEDPRGGERPCCGHPNALTDPLHAIPTAGRGDTDSSGEAIEPGLSAESNGRRLRWFTDAELAAELTRRALDGA